MNNEDKAELAVNRLLTRLDNEEITPAQALELTIKVALPIFLKTMTEKQAIGIISTHLHLDQSQVGELIDLAKRNAIQYDKLKPAPIDVSPVQPDPATLDKPTQDGSSEPA